MRKNTIRILVICKGHRNIAGAQLYLQNLSTLFTSEKYELHFALRKKDGLRVFSEIAKHCKIKIWEYDWRHLGFAKSFKKGMTLYKKILPELILFNSAEDEVIAPLWASFLCHIPNRAMVVHWAQSPDSLSFFKKKSGIPFPSRYAIKTRLLRAISYMLLHKIIFVNNITRKAFIRLYKIPPKRCETIYNGVNLSKFSNAADQRQIIRKKLNLKPSECMIFASGNLTQVKGHIYLIHAMKRLLAEGIDFKCFIAGQGELKESLHQKILDLGIEKNVTLLGYRNDIPLLLSATDIFCMPSLNEALGYSLLEALAAGIPIVASNVGGIPEVITDGIDGILCEPGNEEKLYLAIKKLWGNDNLRKEMALNGLKKVEEKFSLTKTLQQTEYTLKQGFLNAN